MRILIIHTSYKVKGGEDSVVQNETALLLSAGHEVEVLLFSNAENTFTKIAQLHFNYGAYNQTKRTIRAYQPDAIHIHNLHFAGSPSVLYAAKKSKIPVVVTLHNYRLLCPSGTLYFNNAIFTSSVYQLFPMEAVNKGVYQNSKFITFWLALNGAIHQLAGSWRIPSKFIVLGNTQKEIFSDSKYHDLIKKMEIKPNFCYPYKGKKISEGGYYLYVGRLSSEKGIDTMLRAFIETGLPLRIVGTGPLEEEVKKYAVERPNITFLGSKEKETVDELLANAIALVFSSVWFETFGMVIIEAFAAGTPVIASNIGEAKNLVMEKHNGLLFEPGNSKDLIGQLNYYEALTATEKANYNTAALQTYEANYTPAANLKKLEEIYREVTR